MDLEKELNRVIMEFNHSSHENIREVKEALNEERSDDDLYNQVITDGMDEISRHICYALCGFKNLIVESRKE